MPTANTFFGLFASILAAAALFIGPRFVGPTTRVDTGCGAWDLAPKPMTPLPMDNATVYAMSQSITNEGDPQLLELRPDVSFRTWTHWDRWGRDASAYAFSFIAQCHAANILTLGGNTVTVLFEDELTPTQFQQMVTRDASGGLVPHDEVQRGAHRGSIANPDYREYVEKLCRVQIDGGVDGLFLDEVNHDYDGRHGDNNEGFDDYHIADFNAYLLAKYPTETDFMQRFKMTPENRLWRDVPAGDLGRNFNYRRYLQANGWATHPFSPDNPLAAEWGRSYDDHPEPGAKNFVSAAEPYRYFGQMVRNLKAYAREKYGRTLYITANGIMPNVDFQSVGLWDGNRDGDNGTEANYVPVVDGHLDGRASLQSVFRRFRARSEELAPGVPVVVFLDWPTATLNRYIALPAAEREDYWRIYAAEAYANGLFFAFHLKTTTGEPTAEAQGMMPFFKRYAGFYRTHASLYHHQQPSDKIVSVSQSGIATAVWEQAQPNRTLVHLVNHNYGKGVLAQENVTVRVALPAPPRAVTEVSPDINADAARSFDYASGTLSVTLPKLMAYSVIVVE